MTSASDVLSENHKKLVELQGQIDALHRGRSEILQLLDLYPDLQQHVGRWKKTVWCSVSANGACTGVEFRFNCGCCPDSPLEVWPYLETPAGRVYSNPASYQIGEKGDPAGVTPYEGWEERLRNAGLSDEVLDVARDHLKAADREREDAVAEEERDRRSACRDEGVDF